MKEENIKINLVAGCGHTGSTIISRIIGEHSKIFFPNKETNIFLLYNYFNEKNLISQLKKECIKNNQKQILEKTNRHIWHIDYIRKKFKKIKFILITRDARNVIASLFKRNLNKNLSTLNECINRYRDDSICTIRQLNNNDTILIRYEDFINNPKKILIKIFTFLNLKYEENVMTYHKNIIDWNGQTKRIKTSGKGEKNHDLLRNWQINQKIYKVKKEWHDIIPKKYHSHINQFMKKNGFKIMKELGYKNINVSSKT